MKNRCSLLNLTAVLILIAVTGRASGVELATARSCSRKVCVFLVTPYRVFPQFFRHLDKNEHWKVSRED